MSYSECRILTFKSFLFQQNPNPETLVINERKPLLSLTSIRSLIDLHPFFQALVRVTNSSTLTKVASSDSSSGAADTQSFEEDPVLYMDEILERDFIEEVSST